MLLGCQGSTPCQCKMADIYLRTPYAWPDIQLKDPTASGGATTISNVGAIASLESFGTLGVLVDISLSGIASLEAFGNPSLAYILDTLGIATQEAFGEPTITSGLTISNVGNIASAEAFGTTELVVRIEPQGVPTGEVFGLPSFSFGLVLSSIPSAEAFGSSGWVLGGPFLPGKVTFGAGEDDAFYPDGKVDVNAPSDDVAVGRKKNVFKKEG